METSVNDSGNDGAVERHDPDSSEDDGELILKAAHEYADNQFQDLVAHLEQDTHITGKHYRQ